jgi:hypothetical protein
VSIEVREHGRPQDVTWVEQAFQKHQTLPTNALILIATNGFTAGARLKAAKLGVTLSVPGEADEKAAVRALGRAEYREFKGVPDKVHVMVPAIADLPSQAIVAAPDLVLFRSDGSRVGFLIEAVQDALQKADLRDLVVQATGEEDRFVVSFAPHYVDEHDAARIEPLFVQKEDENPPLLREVQEIRVYGEAKLKIVDVPLTYGELRGTSYATGTASTGDADLILFATHEAPEAGKVTVKVLPSKQKSAETQNPGGLSNLQ